ncbi:MAG: XdhC family protein [Aestuariivita sp.]|nr:XdhC family protein [Aestuariivita sp.]
MKAAPMTKLAKIGELNQIPETALAWYQAGKGAVVATVIETWGSAPRRVGAQLVVSGDSEIEGSVSGGCVEGAVVHEALEALQEKQHRVLEFGVAEEEAFAVGLACGGQIKILVEPVGTVLPVELLRELVDARQRRKAVAYVVNLVTGDRRLAYDGFEERVRMDRSGFENQREFVTLHNAPLRLVAVGAVHIAQALLPMSRIVGYDSIVIDPRESFATSERFPDDTIVIDWPDEALATLGLDVRTALVSLTHDPKLDDPSLEFALNSEAFYIGALGSIRTHASRLDRLRKNGFDEQSLERIHGPIGLDIGAASPEEIALAILAQMTARLRGL